MMKSYLNKINGETVFKVLLLIFIGYFLYLLTIIAIQIKSNGDVGRYQFHNDKPFLIDTKTGEVKRYNRP